jgi:hypothetical protein
MYAGTIFQYDDQSKIPALPVAEAPYKPLVFMGISSDKGTEDYVVIEGDQFFTDYGDISFKKHGQPLLQAANIINAGGRLFVKRIVAPDSKLANIAVIAHVKKVEEQKTNSSGQKLYTTTDGVETIEAAGNTPIMVTKAGISYELKTVENAGNDLDFIATSVYASANFTEQVNVDASYPLFVITDIGRGISKKKVRIAPDYSGSKNYSFLKYTIEVFENNKTLETMQFTLDPEIIYDEKSVAMETVIKSKSHQIKCKMFQDAILAMYENVAAIGGLESTDLRNQDILFGKTKKAVSIDTISVDLTAVNISSEYGLSLLNGTNGSFGLSPITAVGYTTEMVKVYDGTFSKDIYDVDNYKIDVIIDANYEAPVKRAAEALVTFREDCEFLEDLGIGLNNTEDIFFAAKSALKNKFVSVYHNSYDIIDPYSYKQISVTIMYDLAAAAVKHISTGRNRPLAGILYSITFPNAIKGTVNFIPKIIPGLNQKEELADARINYASYYDDLLVMETEYTFQEDHTQFSYLNNMLAVQEVMKAIRTRCPKTRYSFIEGDDLEKYLADTTAVIDKYRGNFKSIELVYIEDEIYVANKIFYAALKVRFKNFVQTEIFKITALL